MPGKGPSSSLRCWCRSQPGTLAQGKCIRATPRRPTAHQAQHVRRPAPRAPAPGPGAAAQHRRAAGPRRARRPRTQAARAGRTPFCASCCSAARFCMSTACCACACASVVGAGEARRSCSAARASPQAMRQLTQATPGARTARGARAQGRRCHTAQGAAAHPAGSSSPAARPEGWRRR